jgi:hypothetical protein
MFLVAILFLNLLIAIIVDSYTIVGQQAETSFWTQRMLFILDVNQMQRACNRISRFISFKSKTSSSDDNGSDEINSNPSLFNYWERILSCFHDKRLENVNEESTLKFCTLSISRCACIIIIPTWLLLGAVSAGYLWPPQVRKWLFFAKEENKNEVLSVGTDGKKIVDVIQSFQNEIMIANQTTSSCFVKFNYKLEETKKQMLDEVRKVSNPAISIGTINDKIEQLAVEMRQINEAKCIESAENLLEIRQLKAELNDIKNLLMNMLKGGE